jgi:hypothetical protein
MDGETKFKSRTKSLRNGERTRRKSKDKTFNTEEGRERRKRERELNLRSFREVRMHGELKSKFHTKPLSKSERARRKIGARKARLNRAVNLEWQHGSGTLVMKFQPASLLQF